MAHRTTLPALTGTGADGRDAVWMLVDLLASIVGADDREAAAHIRAMNARGSVEGQRRIVADMSDCDHPRVVEALDLLAVHHPDPAVGREARKSVLRARSRLAGCA